MSRGGPTLYITGLGLSPRNITTEALEIMRLVDVVFLETYTSKGPVEFMNYLRSIRNDLILVSREDLENRNGDVIMRELERGHDAALLVFGDPMIATTHAAIAVIAKKHGFNVKIVNSVSIVCALLSQLGLSPYKLGSIATVTYPRMGVLSTRAYDVLGDNLKRGLHTILLLDIRDDEGFMSANEAVDILRRLEEERKLGIVNERLLVIYVARLGWVDHRIVVSTVNNVPDIGDTPHTIVIPGLLNPVEVDYLVHVLNASKDFVDNHQRFIHSLTVENK
ncbi:MAG: diphthine synthase [Vulcanisaeta sp.]|uniref:diphthine synthase n=1 Tax=Vulcanisaeta sp. TaxID=2020871 RepID=UPI003D0F07BD